jgi:hypothetical protein
LLLTGAFEQAVHHDGRFGSRHLEEPVLQRGGHIGMLEQRG